MNEPLAPQYNPSSIESELYQWWNERGLFSPDSHGPGSAEPYVIMMPPPNVTAVLHMGHGLNNTVQDVLIRFERMRGLAAGDGPRWNRHPECGGARAGPGGADPV